MGYYTEFQGEFEIEPHLDEKHLEYLTKFCDTRRMTRDPEILSKHTYAPVGEEGEFYVESDCPESILDHNTPPSTQPGLWCGYTFTEETLSPYDGKNYNTVQWLRYLIDNFLNPWGYNLNGQVRWRGEDFDDIGSITVTDNRVKVRINK